MIPLADNNPTSRKPYVVYGLIALNVLVYVIDSLGPRQVPGMGSLWNFSMVPYNVITGEPVQIPIRIGQQIGLLVYRGLDPAWLTIFTSMFMHAGLLHIGSNLLYLWIFGNNIEDTLGHFKFLLFYLICGVLAAIAHIGSDPASRIPTVGASGAIAGVLGAYLVLFPRAEVRTLVLLGFFWTWVEVPALLVLGVWFLLQLTGVLGSGGELGGGVAYWAHIGGFIAGFVLILALGGRKLARRRRRSYERYDDDRPYPWRRW